MDVNIFKCMLNVNDMRFESLSCPQNISDSLGKAVAKENKLTLYKILDLSIMQYLLKWLMNILI